MGEGEARGTWGLLKNVPGRGEVETIGREYGEGLDYAAEVGNRT